MPHMLHDILGEGSLVVGTPRPQNIISYFLMNEVAADLLLMRCVPNADKSQFSELHHFYEYIFHFFPIL